MNVPSAADLVGPGLAAYGWSEEQSASFARQRASGLVPARVARVDRGRCEVVTGRDTVQADLAPNLGCDGLPRPCTGDWVAVRFGADGDVPLVAELLPRRTALVRASSSGRSEGQVLAANMDTVALAVSLTVAADLGRVERLLALAWESGAQPLVVLTKADQVAPAAAEAVHDDVAAVAPGVEIVATSAASGAGMDELAALVTGTVVLVGLSGVGKSTLGNALLGVDRLAVNAVRAQDGKGRHTTARREMLPLPGGGVLIDTPGLRAVGLWAADSGLSEVFSEIEELARRCRFRDCAHQSEPGCAVLAAVAAEELPARRLDSYRKLARENTWIASRTDARLRAERVQQWKIINKAQRQIYKQRGR